MRRTNQRFNKRVKVRDGMDERVIYLEKANDIMLRSTFAQFNINKELQGKHNTINGKILKIYQQLKEITDDDGSVAEAWLDKIKQVADGLENLVNKVDVMEEVLEDIA